MKIGFGTWTIRIEREEPDSVINQQDVMSRLGAIEDRLTEIAASQNAEPLSIHSPEDNNDVIEQRLDTIEEKVNGAGGSPSPTSMSKSAFRPSNLAMILTALTLVVAIGALLASLLLDLNSGVDKNSEALAALQPQFGILKDKVAESAEQHEKTEQGLRILYRVLERVIEKIVEGADLSDLNQRERRLMNNFLDLGVGDGVDLGVFLDGRTPESERSVRDVGGSGVGSSDGEPSPTTDD